MKVSIKKTNTTEKIFLTLALLCVIAFVFNVSSVSGKILHMKQIIAGQSNLAYSNDNKNVIEKYKQQLFKKENGSIPTKDITFLGKRDESYVFQIKMENGTTILTAITLNNKEGIEAINVKNNNLFVTNKNNVLSYISSEQEILKNWKIDNWISTSEFTPDFGNTDKFNMLPFKKDLSGQISIALSKDFILDNASIEDTSAVTFSTPETTYRISVKPMERVYESNKEVLEALKSWQEDNQNFFKEFDSSYTSEANTAFLYTFINGQKYPVGVGVVKNTNKSTVQETFILIIFIPEKNQEVLFLGNHIEYPLTETTSDPFTETTPTISTTSVPSSDSAENYMGSSYNYPSLSRLVKDIEGISLQIR